jgi:hypothetical protein
MRHIAKRQGGHQIIYIPLAHVLFEVLPHRVWRADHKAAALLCTGRGFKGLLQKVIVRGRQLFEQPRLVPMDRPDIALELSSAKTIRFGLKPV